MVCVFAQVAVTRHLSSALPHLFRFFRPPATPSDSFGVLVIPQNRLAGPLLSRSPEPFAHDQLCARLFPARPRS